MTDSRPTWDETWIAVARDIALRSPCDRDKVGAVIVDRSNRIVDTGYNGPPRGMPREEAGCADWCPRAKTGYMNGEPFPPLSPCYDDCLAIHAEPNALLFSDRTRREGGTIYVTSAVCFSCAKLVANSGLDAVVIDGTRPAVHRAPHRSIEFMEKCGLTVIIL